MHPCLRLVRAVLAAISIAGVGSCSTPYGSMGLMGGVDATPLSSDTEMIEAKGNAYTSATRIQQFVLLKAAQDCLNQGYDRFYFISAEDTSRSGAFVLPGQSQSYSTVTGYGNMATVSTRTYSTPGTIVPMVKPGATVTVKFIRNSDPGSSNAFDARTIAANLGAKLNG